MIVGQRWLTRSGAVVEIVERRDTGLTQYDSVGRPSKAWMLICRFVCYADGDPLTDEPPGQFGLHEDGHYCGHEHANPKNRRTHHLKGAERMSITAEKGVTYQLNNSTAVVTQVSDDEVVWVEPRHAKSRRLSWMSHRCPRWFFERYATIPRSLFAPSPKSKEGT